MEIQVRFPRDFPASVKSLFFWLQEKGYSVDWKGNSGRYCLIVQECSYAFRNEIHKYGYTLGVRFLTARQVKLTTAHSSSVNGREIDNEDVCSFCRMSPEERVAEGEYWSRIRSGWYYQIVLNRCQKRQDGRSKCILPKFPVYSFFK